MEMWREWVMEVFSEGRCTRRGNHEGRRLKSGWNERILCISGVLGG